MVSKVVANALQCHGIRCMPLLNGGMFVLDLLCHQLSSGGGVEVEILTTLTCGRYLCFAMLRHRLHAIAGEVWGIGMTLI